MSKINEALFDSLRCLKWGGFDISSEAMYFDKEIVQYVEVEKENYHARRFNEAGRTSELENRRVIIIIIIIIILLRVFIILGGTWY